MLHIVVVSVACRVVGVVYCLYACVLLGVRIHVGKCIICVECVCVCVKCVSKCVAYVCVNWDCESVCLVYGM